MKKKYFVWTEGILRGITGLVRLMLLIVFYNKNKCNYSAQAEALAAEAVRM